MTVSPIAFLVVSDSGVEILNVNKEPSGAADTISDLIAKAPDLVNKVKDTFKKKDTKEEETVE